jgi:hypothetical protein
VSEGPEKPNVCARPPEFEAAVKQALDRIDSDGDDGSVDFVVRSVARAVWDAGVRHGRRLARAEMRRLDALQKSVDALREAKEGSERR